MKNDNLGSFLLMVVLFGCLWAAFDSSNPFLYVGIIIVIFWWAYPAYLIYKSKQTASAILTSVKTTLSADVIAQIFNRFDFVLKEDGEVLISNEFARLYSKTELKAKLDNYASAQEINLKSYSA